MKKPLIILSIILIIGIIAVLTVYIGFNFMLSPTGSGNKEIEFKVEKGWTHSRVAKELKEEGFIRNWFIYNVYVKLYRKDAKVYPGDFLIKDNMSIDDIISTLNVSQTVRDLIVIIPEGKSSFEIAEEILNKPLQVKKDNEYDEIEYVELDFSSEIFISLVHDNNFINEVMNSYPVKVSSLEGLLFPSKHFIPENYDERKIIKFLVNAFFSKFSEEISDLANIDTILKNIEPLNFQQMLTLASIVVKETASEKERDLVAGVYLNRIKTPNWVLNADPTIIYGLKLTGKWNEDLKTSLGLKPNGNINWDSFNSPYNSYRREGLPPTPIANPGISSINAAINPKQTDYFFFVAKNDGTKEHYFAKTLSEHNKNVALANMNGD